jgi:hypothetical protein
VIARVLAALDALYAEHYPQQESLAMQLTAEDFHEAEPETLDKPPAPRADSAATQGSPLQRAQQLKVLRVLRHIVLPEMVPRVLA